MMRRTDIVRTCKLCKQTKSLDDFYKFRKDLRPYPDTYCKICRRETTAKGRRKEVCTSRVIANSKELTVAQIKFIQSLPWRYNNSAT